MCKFFSLLSNGNGKTYYLNAKDRKEVRGPDLYPDSHSSIVEFYKRKGKLALKPDTEDKLNKYEYNPITGKFRIDQINTRDDSKSVERQCRKLDFKTIIPELVIKPIFHPFSDRNRKRVTGNDIQRLREWVSLRDSMWDSLMCSVWESVRSSVRESLRETLREDVRDSVRNPLRESLSESAGKYVGGSVRDSVHAYISSFFILEEWKHVEHEKGINPFQPGIELWESGLVPSFDGKTWRLHGGSGNVVFEISKEELMKQFRNTKDEVKK